MLKAKEEDEYHMNTSRSDEVVRGKVFYPASISSDEVVWGKIVSVTFVLCVVGVVTLGITVSKSLEQDVATVRFQRSRYEAGQTQGVNLLRA